MKGLGLNAKVLLFSFLPAVIIVAVLLSIYIIDLTGVITDQYKEEALAASSRIQANFSDHDFIEDPSSLQDFLELFARVNPHFRKINIYLRVCGDSP